MLIEIMGDKSTLRHLMSYDAVAISADVICINFL